LQIMYDKALQSRKWPNIVIYFKMSVFKVNAIFAYCDSQIFRHSSTNQLSGGYG
jgi:hypothetical protein